MKWQRGYRSSDVIDERGGGGVGLGSGLLGPFVAIGSRFGIIGILAAVGLYVAARAFMGGETAMPAAGTSAEERRGAASSSDELTSFVSFVFDDVQSVWEEKLSERGRTYDRAKLVLFSHQTSSACGFGSAAVGPFYCPSDHRVYIDLAFYRELARRFGAPGDFAQAYVIAHEVGHHVQGLLGLGPRAPNHVQPRRETRSEESVKFELQADCLAGIWANASARRNLLEEGDIEEALTAATAIGDDRLQAQSTGAVRPETFTHGSSEQRVRWFKRGLAAGKVDACDTFSVATL